MAIVHGKQDGFLPISYPLTTMAAFRPSLKKGHGDLSFSTGGILARRSRPIAFDHHNQPAPDDLCGNLSPVTVLLNQKTP